MPLIHPCRNIPVFLALIVLGWLSLIPAATRADNLQTFDGCQWVSEDWADGDSFPVRFPDGSIQNLRLYGVDCLESSVEHSDSNARRLRDQRRWFGISDIESARRLGVAGKTETRRLLSRPFTVHTANADARGDPRYQRIYAFVTTSSGRDLSELLVASGLARAFGVVRQRPDGTPGDEWREQLRDLEFRAAKKGLGAWALTDWDQFPDERRAAREEAAELAAITSSGPKSTPQSPVNLNTASRDELLSLPGIGEVIALRIIERRPYAKTSDLLSVPGIGVRTLERLEPFVEVKRR